MSVALPWGWAGTGTAPLLLAEPREMHFYDWEEAAEGRVPAQGYEAAAELLPRRCRREDLTLPALKIFLCCPAQLLGHPLLQRQARETVQKEAVGFKILLETAK